jgi:serine/threonine-protein kinase
VNRPDLVARFLREIQAVAKLRHPNIVAASTASRIDEDGEVFLVMEDVDGVDLARYVRDRGPLPVAQACALACQVAEALQHAHEQGMVHRDIKPSNRIRRT